MRRQRAILVYAAALLLCWGARAGALTCGDVTRVYEDYGKVYFECAGAKIEVQTLERGVVRIELLAPEVNSKFETYMTQPGALRKVRFDWSAEKGRIVSDDAKVSFTLKPFSMEFQDTAGRTLARLAPGGVEWAADGSYTLTFKRDVSDHFFGLGEPLPGVIGEKVSMDYRGRKRSIWNQHVPPADLGLPFFISPKGYAMLVENPWRAEFDFSKSGAFTYSAKGGPARFYVFPGKGLDVLESYAALTGRTPMPPKWATGYMQSRYGYVNDKDFRWLMDNFRSRRLPCDTLIYDLYWFGQGGMGNLWWTPENFPDPTGLMKESRERGFKTIVIVEPYVMGSSTNQMEVFARKLSTMSDKKQPYLFPFWGRMGSMLLDFMNPKTQEWFAKQVLRIHGSGVDAWWTDLTEPEVDAEDMVYYGGLHRDAAHNLQALLMHKGMAEMYSKNIPDERLFIMSRSGFVGDWRYGSSVWSGDVTASWNHLAAQIPIGLSLNLSGYGIWNSDIGGFHNHPSPEMFTRWMQFGAFCPVFRAHGNHDIREPWSFGEQTEETLRELLNVRYRLSPYLYTMFHELNRYGRPTMRAMWLEFPGDEKAWDAETQYMYGRWLLVAPVTREGAVTRSVYFPKGVWTDFWTEKEYVGPATVKVDAPLDRIPVFVREGAVVPMAPPAQFIGERAVDPLTLQVYPGAAESSYSVYEDDGLTNAYENGAYARLSVKVVPGAKLTIRVADREGRYAGAPPARAYVVAIHRAAAPGKIALNGKAVPQKAEDVETATPAGAAWSYDATARIARLYVPSRATGFTIELAAAAK